MEATPEIDAQVEEVATAVYGKRPSVTKLSSENNYVCRLDWDAFEPAVLKAAVAPHLHESVRTEAEVLGRLGSRGLPVPIVHFTEADAPSAPWPFFAGPFIDGDPLDVLCSERDPRALIGCRAAGAFLARLHREPMSLLDGLEVQHYPLLKRLDFDGQRWSAIRDVGVDAARLAPVAEVITAAIARPERHLVHDSLAPIHVRLGDREDVAILDWETARPGFALHDLAVLIASIRMFNSGTPEQCRAALVGYASADPPVALDRAELDAWQVYQLLDWASFYLRTDRAELARQVIGVAMDNL